MTEVLHKIAAVFGKEDSTASNNDLETDKNKTPAEQIKEKAIEQERKEVADGSTTGHSSNGISTTPEEAHATDGKDKDISSTSGALATTNGGADDNASMIPLGKGSETAPPMNAGNDTSNTISSNTTTVANNEGPTTITSIMAMEASSTSVTRAEIDSAKEAIIRAVANCTLTREVVFSDTDTGTEDGQEEVKRVISGYKGIDEALTEMNRYIPHNVRDSHDLGVAEGERIREEQQSAANVITADQKDSSSSKLGNTTSTAGNIRDLDEKITEKEALAITPTGLPSSTIDTNTNTNTTSDTQDALTDLQKEELNRVPEAGESTVFAGEEPEHERGITLGAGVLPGAGAAAGAIIPLAHIEDGKPAEPVVEEKSVEPVNSATDKGDVTGESTGAVAALPLSSSDNDTTGAAAVSSEPILDRDISAAAVSSTSDSDKDTSGAAISSLPASDQDTSRAVGEETGEKAATSTPSSPTASGQGEKLYDRLRREVEERARRGQLGVYNKPLGTSASTASFASASKDPASATTASSAKAKEAPASSAFTEEFGPGETGLSPSSPTAATTGTSSTKPPSTRARATSISSQTSTGEKRGLLGLFRRRSKRQSVSDGSNGRRASQDLGRTASKDTTATTTTTPASPVTATAVPPVSDKPVETVDSSAVPTTDSKDIAAGGDDNTTALATSGTEASTTEDASGITRKESPDDMLGPGAAAILAAQTAEKNKEEHVVVDKENEGDMIGPGALAGALGETSGSTAPATESKSTTTAEPTTSEHKVEDVDVPFNEVSTQTKHEPAPALGTAVEPITYIEEPAPSTGAADAAVVSHDEKSDGLLGPSAVASSTGETSEPVTSENTKAATADKGTSTSAEKATSTEEDLPIAVGTGALVDAAPPTASTTAAPVTHTSDDVPLYSKPSLDRNAPPALERKTSNSKSGGGFFGLFRRRSSRRSSSGPPQRSVSDISKPVPVESTPATTTGSHVTPALVADEKIADKEEVKPITAIADEHDGPVTHTTQADASHSEAAGSELVRSDTDKIIAAEAEAYSEATIHAYGALNVDELETVEEEMERGPEETVAEPHKPFRDDDEDEELDLHNPDEIASEPSEQAAASRAETPAAASVYEEAPEVPEERVTSPVVASTPAERLISGERRKSRSGGFFGLFRSRTHKDKEQSPSHSRPQSQTYYPQVNPYEDVVRNVGRVDLPEKKKIHKETKDIGTAMSETASARSPAAVRTRTRSVTSPAPGDSSIIDHGTTHGDHADEEEEYEESVVEEEIPDNRSITEIAASIPLPAPVYTDKTRAKHERLRKKREHEEAIERERIRKENEILAKRERIMTAYTGKQDFTKVPKPARTKNFGRAHERKDLDGVQFVNKADKKAAKKNELTKTTSRGSSIEEPSSPSHPASGGLVGSFPAADKTNTRVSHASAMTSDRETDHGSPSPPTSPIIKLGRRVSTLVASKREKPVEVAAA